MFIQALIHENRLDRFDFKRWLFFPGMLFGSRSSWWGAGRPRPFSHEGLDLCFFEAKDRMRFRFDPSIRIPAAADGRIVSIMDDLLGKTIVCDHGRRLGTSTPMVMLYAHVLPEKALRPGDAVDQGACIARIAPADTPKNGLPPHLHLSAVKRDALPDTFDWPYLNRLDRSAFIDPARVAGLTAEDAAIIHFDPSMALYSAFRPCPGPAGPQQHSSKA